MAIFGEFKYGEEQYGDENVYYSPSPIVNQYWGQTQSVLGATLLEGNPILKIREGYVVGGYSFIWGYGESVSPGVIGTTTNGGASWTGLTNAVTPDGIYAQTNLGLNGISIPLFSEIAATSDFGALYTGWRTGQAQSFVLGSTELLYSATFNLLRYGNPTGFVNAALYNDIGSSFGLDSKPGSSLWAVSNNVGTTVISNSVWQNIVFSFSGSSPIYIGMSVPYCIAIGYSGGGISDFIGVRLSSNYEQAEGSWAVFQSAFSGWTPRYNFDAVSMAYKLGLEGVVSDYITFKSNGVNGISNAIITGMELYVKYGVSGAGEDAFVGTIKANGVVSSYGYSSGSVLDNSGQYVKYGSSASSWGETWSLNDVGSTNFGWAISVRNIGSTASILIDDVYGVIYYYGNTVGNIPVYGEEGRYSVKFINNNGYDRQQIVLNSSDGFDFSLNQRNILSQSYRNRFGYYKPLSTNDDTNIFSFRTPSRWGVTGNRLFTSHPSSYNNNLEIGFIEKSADDEDCYISIRAPAMWTKERGSFGVFARANNIGTGKETMVAWRYYSGKTGYPYGSSYWANSYFKFERWSGGSIVYGVSYRGHLYIPEDSYLRLGMVARGSNYELSWDVGGTYGTISGLSSRQTQYITDGALTSGGAGILTVGIGSSADYADEPIPWYDLVYTPIGTAQKRLQVLKDRIAFAGDYSFDDDMFVTSFGITELAWKTLETDYYKEPFEGVSIYKSGNNRVLRIRTGLSDGTIYSGFKGVSFWGIYKTTGYSYSDFIFTVEGLVNSTGSLNNKYLLVCGNSADFYEFETSNYYQFAWWWTLPMSKRAKNNIFVDGFLISSKLAATEPRIWQKFMITKVGPHISWYVNGNLVVDRFWDGGYSDMNNVGVGFGVWGRSTSAEEIFYFKNPKIEVLNPILDEQHVHIGDEISSDFYNYLPPYYELKTVGQSSELKKIGLSTNDIGISNYYRIAETKNYGKFAKYIYAKGDEVAGSNLSGLSRVIMDAGSNEWIDYQDSNLKTETITKELGADKLKEDNDDSDLYSMVNLPNVLLKKGDKVDVVDEALGISDRYLVDTHLKRWNANGEFIQYTGLVRDDT